MPQRVSRPLRCSVQARSLCAALLVGSLLVACDEAPQPAPTPSLKVETVAPRTRDLAREVVASGAIAA